MSHALPVFSSDQKLLVQKLLALRVAQMMGRKLEEDDWTSVYCAAKGIPDQAWSNLNIDVMFGHLGIEHKMLCYRSKPSLLEACGTSLMHPAATRSLRVGNLSGDPDKEMESIFEQYADLLESRRETVATRGGVEPSAVDLRTGWLLWQESHREFLYFEEEMLAPDPGDFYAEWVERSDGKRKGSKNLWIYEKKSGKKRYSLTTTAGVKLQPYFDVPGAKDANLYHWTVIGEVVRTGDVRLWLTSRTATALEAVVGSLGREEVSLFIRSAANKLEESPLTQLEPSDEAAVVEVFVAGDAYRAITEYVPSTNDDHLIQQLLDDWY
ncbi:hypothetical protein SAMN06265174_102323 [Dietzia kunjamensis subsp. schimae]|uniref:Uncharacterized protein n=1 Tax=Dietzia kunjamensis subsp. schimae TaxID=498198 RepID=A0ABY1MYY8_9ACTN|nr:hypothetical protein [Dietzia kunjamensis]MBB1014977.1 hypothetical protein [Dietzia kunjamensis subsp. schimae]SMO55975.1 hypothetical protein SAMN06265174_102323 [Dietzia kunjamensis subsp. schimae]